jgi:hypothetical protein
MATVEAINNTPVSTPRQESAGSSLAKAKEGIQAIVAKQINWLERGLNPRNRDALERDVMQVLQENGLLPLSRRNERDLRVEYHSDRQPEKFRAIYDAVTQIISGANSHAANQQVIAETSNPERTAFEDGLHAADYGAYGYEAPVEEAQGSGGFIAYIISMLRGAGGEPHIVIDGPLEIVNAA